MTIDTYTMSDAEVTALEDHVLAALFPMLPEDELEALADAMLSSNIQRDPIVIHEGKILDGRNTLKALGIAGMTPRFRDYDPGTEGPAWKYVRDRNLTRRNLDPTQRAAIVSGLLQHSDDAAALSVAEMAAVADVSPRTMTDAIAAEEAGHGKDMRDGKTSASAAAKKARKDKPQKPKAEKPTDEAASAALRAEKESEVKKIHGDQFARAFGNGTILKKLKDIKEFLDLDAAAQKDLVPYLAEGWTLDKAIKFHNSDVTTEDSVESLILRVTANGGKPFKAKVAGYEITIKRATAAE